MRALKLFSALALLLLAAAPLQAEEFDPGIDYTVLPQPIPTDVPKGKVEVAEFFWYGCPHCYRFEPHVQKWLKHKPEAAAFVRIPASLNPSWRPHAEAYYAAQTLGVTDK
ncbi:MAG: thiol:disulfide interchange protein DsbA/DsbL, partial [Gammaproteobacteria bacterium]